MKKLKHTPPSPIYGLKIISWIPGAVNNNYTIGSKRINSHSSSSSWYKGALHSSILRIVKCINKLLSFETICPAINSVLYKNNRCDKLLKERYTRIVTHNLNTTQTQASDQAYTHIYSHTQGGRNGHGSDLGRVQST